MRIIDCQQGSPEWWEARKGIPTASGFSRIITSQGHPSKGMDKYIAELIADTSMQLPTYFTTQGRPVTKAMTNGTDCEPEARRFYELERDCTVRTVGFVLHDSGLFGCSPDGLIDPDGGLELKCPETKTQAEYLMKNRLPIEYKAQVHGSLVVTGRKWWDFLSYSHGLKPLLIRVVPDEFTVALADALAVFVRKYAEARVKLLDEPESNMDEYGQWLGKLDELMVSPSLEAINNGFIESFKLLPKDRPWRGDLWRIAVSAFKRSGFVFNETTKMFEEEPR